MGVESAITVANLVGELGRVEGRKRLQKIVHLLGVSGAREFRYRFILHYYGPFSRELASDLDFLQDAKLLLEKSPPAGVSGAYVYTLPSSKKVKKTLRLHSLDPAGEKPAWVVLAKRLDQAHTGLLEAFSTVVFLAGLGKTGPALKLEFARVKPDLKDEFEAALELGRELNLPPRPVNP